MIVCIQLFQTSVMNFQEEFQRKLEVQRSPDTCSRSHSKWHSRFEVLIPDPLETSLIPTLAPSQKPLPGQKAKCLSP